MAKDKRGTRLKKDPQPVREAGDHRRKDEYAFYFEDVDGLTLCAATRSFFLPLAQIADYYRRLSFGLAEGEEKDGD